MKSFVCLLAGICLVPACRSWKLPWSKQPTFRVLDEVLLYDNWRTLTRRNVRLGDTGKVADFEIVGQRGTDQAVVVFVYHSHNQTATIIREYMPAANTLCFGLAAGMVDASERPLTAAKRELREECGLQQGHWYKLTKNPVYMDKYSSTRLSAFLVVDPISAPTNRDETEVGMEVHTVPCWKLHKLTMTVVGRWGILLALQKLHELGVAIPPHRSLWNLFRRTLT